MRRVVRGDALGVRCPDDQAPADQAPAAFSSVSKIDCAICSTFAAAW
jgi:hypothetical protein